MVCSVKKEKRAFVTSEKAIAMDPCDRKKKECICHLLVNVHMIKIENVLK